MVQMDVPQAIEAAWNAWYDETHIPNRLKRVPGFLSARRFIIQEDKPKYLTLYDLRDADVLTSETYLALRAWEASLPQDSLEATTLALPGFARGVYEQIYSSEPDYRPPDTHSILVVGHDVPAEKEAEFNAWYETEHIPALLKVAGVVTARRLMTAQTELPPKSGLRSPGPKYLTLYDLENREVPLSDAYANAVNTPWTSWVRSWAHRRLRLLAERIFPETAC